MLGQRQLETAHNLGPAQLQAGGRAPTQRRRPGGNGNPPLAHLCYWRERRSADGRVSERRVPSAGDSEIGIERMRVTVPTTVVSIARLARGFRPITLPSLGRDKIALPRRAVRWGMRTGLVEGVMAQLFLSVAYGTVITGLALLLGATSFHPGCPTCWHRWVRARSSA